MTAQNAPEVVDTATRVLDVAERLFHRYGWEETTVAAIARELGMSPADVYRFFPSEIAIAERRQDISRHRRRLGRCRRPHSRSCSGRSSTCRPCRPSASACA